MSKNKYRFRLGQGLTLTEVNPLYSSSLDKEYESEEGQKFFREKLTGGDLTFQDADYDFILSRPFSHQYIIQIDKLQTNGSYLNEWFKGSFSRTDCSIDEDKKTIKVTPEPFDKYKPIIDSRNKEFDLIEVSPSVDQLKLTIQPLVQIYSDLSDVLTNVLSGVQFEQPISYRPNFTQELIDVHKFNFIRSLVFIPGDNTLLNPDVSGEYQQNVYASNDNQFQLITIGFVDTFGGLQTDDPEGLAESNFVVASSTLTDEDFLSIWQAPNGNQFEYIGTEMINDVPNLGFRALNADSAPATGTLTHVSGATNTGSLSYSSYDNSTVRTRWGMYWQNPPVPFQSKYLFLAPMQQGLASEFTQESGHVKRSALFSPINGSTGTFKVFVESIYARVLTTSSSFDGNSTFDIPEQDVVSSHGQYNKVIGLNHDSYLLADDNQVESEKYGKFSDEAANYADQYFTKPLVAVTGQLIPLQNSLWSEASLWMIYTPALETLLNNNNTSYILSTVYKLSSVIKSLIREIDPSLTFEEDPAHSEFLFAVNSIRGSIKTPIITPKRNVLSFVEKPSKKATIKFSDIEILLRDFYQAFWYIDDDNRFKIEFVDFFDKGLTYSGVNVNTDLSVLIEPKSGKSWSYKNKKYRYEKNELPERIIHSWMDESSLPFKGVPIETTSVVVEKGNYDQRSLSIFSSDIDFIHSQSASVSPDGFVFFEAVKGQDEFEVPFVEVVIDQDTFNLQNGYASMFWAAEKYWLYNLPFETVLLNYEERTALSVKKTKMQDVEYPSSDDPDPMKLIVSSLGQGSVDKMTQNLSTGLIKITLRHVTE